MYNVQYTALSYLHVAIVIQFGVKWVEVAVRPKASQSSPFNSNSCLHEVEGIRITDLLYILWIQVCKLDR